MPDIDNQELVTLAPVFLVHEPDKPFNRIGTPHVQADAKGNPQILVDPIKGTLYTSEYRFSTNRYSYRNLVYRLHFEKVPFGLDNLHITAGKNPGLFIILTFSSENRLILVTTVHTCGCYLAFIPTTEMDPEAFPENWPLEGQIVYGIKLPAVIRVPEENEKILISLDSGTHRVRNVEIIDLETLDNHTIVNALGILPIDSLWKLPFKNGHVSFFETEGRQKGYVRNNDKHLERLLMSWWTFDWHIGQDKSLGHHETTGTRFYTSLKFWRRKDSDMGDFATFLEYWGWKL